MKILGLQKMTLLDYPGKVACTVFLGGCNLRCPYCHNAPLVLPEPDTPVLEQEDLLSFLKKRQGLLEGVCVSGGEPTLHRELPELLREIRALGYSLKLDTNGTRPAVLGHLLEDGLVDYVAMDIKNSPERYALTCGGPRVLEEVRESVRLLMTGSTDFEFRTTVCHPLHRPEDFEAIGRCLRGPQPYYIQNFRDSGQLLSRGMEPLTKKELEALRQAVLPYIPNTQLRGI